MAGNIEYLKELVSKAKFFDNMDAPFLDGILRSMDIEELPGSPEKYLVKFALGRSTSRYETAKRAGKQTRGMEELIKNLKSLPQEDMIYFYNIKNTEYIGTCFVYEDKIVGYEFVFISGTTSRPGYHPELLT